MRLSNIDGRAHERSGVGSGIPTTTDGPRDSDGELVWLARAVAEAEDRERGTMRLLAAAEDAEELARGCAEDAADAVRACESWGTVERGAAWLGTFPATGASAARNFAQAERRAVRMARLALRLCGQAAELRARVAELQEAAAEQADECLRCGCGGADAQSGLCEACWVRVARVWA